MKYCDGLDCMICDEKEPCIYKRANELQECIDEIEEICSNSLSVKLLFKDRIDLAIFIMKRIKKVKNNG